MTRVKTLVLLLAVTAILSWFTVGCEEESETSNRSDATVTSGQKLCTRDKEAKDSAKCCKPGAQEHKKHGEAKVASDCSKSK